MPDQPKPSRSLSEISHLFLSGIRQRQSAAGGRPVRTAPPRSDDTVDLTPEEFAEVFGQAGDAQSSPVRIGAVTAVLASHLAAQQLARAQQYASHLAAQGRRVGLIAVDASEFRLSVFEASVAGPKQIHGEAQENDVLDARRMSEAIEELAWDVDRWLLLLPSPRAPEARSLLRDVHCWTLLATCDHDGVVAGYRTLKGLSDLHRPHVSLALLDAAGDDQAAQVHQRLAAVCRQFLDWPLDRGPVVSQVAGVSEHVVLWCCATRDKAQHAPAPQWQVVADFLSRASMAPIASERAPAADIPRAQPQAVEPKQVEPSSPAPGQPTQTMTIPQSQLTEVIDLPDPGASGAAIASAVLRGGGEMVECPLKPPMCPDASLAVSRERRLVLMAVARQGPADLRQIARAYQWLIENRALICMALPQMSIDAHQHPQLHLLVDHADMSAEILQPLLHSTSVVVHAYRKLRWGGKTGLLLEAA